MCLTVTLIDGVVLARSAVHQSVNYRSVVVFGQAEAILDPEQKRAAIEAFSERLIPGRWEEVRPPTEKELKAINVLSLPLDEASAKLRTGGPKDDEEDYAREGWAGVIPIATVAGTPLPDERLAPDAEPSSAIHFDAQMAIQQKVGIGIARVLDYDRRLDQSDLANRCCDLTVFVAGFGGPLYGLHRQDRGDGDDDTIGTKCLGDGW
jgi:hypothetical protein